MRSYKFSFNGKTKIIQALNMENAKNVFMERFGFWPSEELVEIEIATIRPVG